MLEGKEAEVWYIRGCTKVPQSDSCLYLSMWSTSGSAQQGAAYVEWEEFNDRGSLSSGKCQNRVVPQATASFSRSPSAHFIEVL